MFQMSCALLDDVSLVTDAWFVLPGIGCQARQVVLPLQSHQRVYYLWSHMI